MEKCHEGYVISDDKEKLSLDAICAMLEKSYWAAGRSREINEKAVEHSVCFGVYQNGLQVGFARAITDHATMYWLCDVIIDDAHRGHALGAALIDFAVNHPSLKDLKGRVSTVNGENYQKFGFSYQGGYMLKNP